MPSIAWFPLAILLFQLSETAILFVVVLGAAPAIANGLISGVDHVPPLLLRAGRVLGATGLANYRHVILPAALPASVAGLKQGWAFAWRSLMAGELLVLIPGQTSVGAQLQFSREFSDAAGLMAMMIVILLIGIVVDVVVFSSLERSIRARRGLVDAAPEIALDALAVESLEAREVLGLALQELGRDRLAIASSFGAEDVVLIDLLASLEPRPRVFTLDTGRLPQETYDLIDQVRRRYSIEVEVYFPQADRVEAMVRSKGLNLFYESIENRTSCCHVRKVEPLGRALATLDGWVTGLRRDQIATRVETAKIAPDPQHGGIWKIAPLADWSSDRVWAYIREHDLPYNALHDQGYPSIGCAPCTRAVQPGEDERAGRWWWEQPEERECGIHFDPRSGRMVRNEPVAVGVAGPFDAPGPLDADLPRRGLT